MNQPTESTKVPHAPAMGERWARWGYGYQDKVATDRLLVILRDGIRSGESSFEGVRFADLQAGRVDDFVLVWNDRVEGSSIKSSTGETSINWGALIGVKGLIKELVDGAATLRQGWPDKAVAVRLQTNNRPSDSRHPNQLISSFSVAEFLRDHWNDGPKSGDSDDLRAAWKKIAVHAGLPRDELIEFTSRCKIILGFPEPPNIGNPATQDEKHYLEQFDRLHKSIATWLINNPNSDFIDRDTLLSAIGFRQYRSGLIQRFPAPQIPYEQNSSSASELEQKIRDLPGGYIAVTGCAGTGKSTLVQDVLSSSKHPYFIPYYSYLPDGQGNPRDRGEALTFFQDVIDRLDRFSKHRYSLGITEIEQGREALRGHMAKANERFVLQGIKTILLIDGLDHVLREVGLRSSVLNELPLPSEIPDGFLIILSTQPQALTPSSIASGIAHAVAENSNQRIEVTGLSRIEVHEIVSKLGKKTSDADRERLNNTCQGNPLILTYLLNAYEQSDDTSVDDVVSQSAEYSGDIEQYYASALSRSLQDHSTRQVLGLLVRAAPTIPVSWLQQWPEQAYVEDLYGNTIAPFVRVKNGHLSFIHNSLIAFLKSTTRSSIKGADHAADERGFHSILADRTSGHACVDPLGQAHVFHLLRAGRRAEVLKALTSTWLRNATTSFLPFALVRPLLLAGLETAWSQQEYGQVVRLVLLDYELDQRSHRIDAGELAGRFLELEKPELALAQIRSAGSLLVEDRAASKFAGGLWHYANSHDSEILMASARELYLQAKPIAYLYFGASIDTRIHHEAHGLLTAWSEVAPLFEAPDDIIAQIKSLHFDVRTSDEYGSESSIKSALLHRVLLTIINKDSDADAYYRVLSEIQKLKEPTWCFAALLAIARRNPSHVSVDTLVDANDLCAGNDDFDLALAIQMYSVGDHSGAKAIIAEKKHIRFKSTIEQRSLGFTDTTYTFQLRCLQELLSIPEGEIPSVEDDTDEASARIEHTARRLGVMYARAKSSQRIPDLRKQIRSALYFQNRSVCLPNYNWRDDYLVQQSKHDIYRQLVKVIFTLGKRGLEALRDTIQEIKINSARSQLSAHQWRYFAEKLFRGGEIDRETAVKLGLSSTLDSDDEDPMTRQDACFDIAVFLHTVGDKVGSREWIRRAGDVSVGAGSHKDYHMASLTEWLDLAIEPRSTKINMELLRKSSYVIEVAGGAGQSLAAVQTIQTAMKISPYSASALAIEFVDRGVINLVTSVKALLIAATKNGISHFLVSAIYRELVSLLDTGSTGVEAAAVLEIVPQTAKVAEARALMSSVRTNSMPSYRIEVARSLQDSLQTAGIEGCELGAGLQPGHDDSSLESSLYRLQNGAKLTVGEVARRLSNDKRIDRWDPNPELNRQFSWWSAIEQSTIQSIDHFEQLLARFSPSDYRAVQLLALKSGVYFDAGNLLEATRLAEEAVEAAKDGSWFRWFDGAQKKIAYGALKRIDRDSAVISARNCFKEDLSTGKLGSAHLLSNLPEIFEFLDIDWPPVGVLEATEAYFDEVIRVSPEVDQYNPLSIHKSKGTVEEALCLFVVYLSAIPTSDIGVAARRCLAKYAREDGRSLATVLLQNRVSDSIQLEQVLAALHVGSAENPSTVNSLRPFLEQLNRHESIAIRSIARRICEDRGWNWGEINDAPKPIGILVPGGAILEITTGEAKMIVGGEMKVGADLHRGVFRSLEKYGNDADDLRSEFASLYAKAENEYAWRDPRKADRWMTMALTRFSQRKHYTVARIAALNLFGRCALSGRTPAGADGAYDALYPVYDADLELNDPIECPGEMRAMDWSTMGSQNKDWLQGKEADDWQYYPSKVGDLCIIAERSYFIRPEWEWPREERYRGILTESHDDEIARYAVSTQHELTYRQYSEGTGQEESQLTIYNYERQLSGPQYRWIAINSNIARQLGWELSPNAKFEWLDCEGNLMVKSVFWKNGWIWLKPPRFETLGGGWLVLASEGALRSMWEAFPEANCHLWIERHSYGDKPYDATWHLTQSMHLGRR